VREGVEPAAGEHIERGCTLHAFDVVAVASEEAGDFGHAKAARVPLQLGDRPRRASGERFARSVREKDAWRTLGADSTFEPKADDVPASGQQP
jgi:hypothetical protein